MMRVRATSDVEHLETDDGSAVALSSRTWQVAVGAGSIGLAWSYRHPTTVELTTSGGRVSRVRLVDHVALFRAAAAVLVLIARLTWRRHR